MSPRDEASSEPPADRAGLEEAETLLAGIGRALHEAGFPAPLLEGSLARLARRLGVTAQFFSTPTSLFTAFGEGATQRTHLARVEPPNVDLGRHAELGRLLAELDAGAITPGEGIARLEQSARAAPTGGSPRRRLLTVACFGLSSAASAVFLGGGAPEIGVAAAIGLGTGLLAWIAENVEGIARLFEPLAAALAAFAALAVAAAGLPLAVPTATLAGLIALLPGFTLTVALSELATRHLASGTARFAGALVTFLSLGFGVALGGKLGEALFGPPTATLPALAPAWAEAVALLVAPLALLALYRAPWSEAPWIVGTGFLGYQGARIGSELLSPELGMFVGALAVGLAGALFERRRRLPAAIPIVPGVLLLVPGSLGYRSLTALLAREVVPGIETAFRMVLVAISLVAGLLMATALTTARRSRPSSR